MRERKLKNIGQRGVAMILALLTLLLLSLIAVSLVYLADTETGVNSNYRSEQQAYFAARAGAEEVRDRMMPLNANTINSGGEGATTSYLPTALPSTSGGVLYVLNPGSGSSTSVQPWNTSNTYPDDEFCHEYGNGLLGSYNTSLTTTSPSSDTSCNASGQPGLPSGTGWYQNPNPNKTSITLTSTAPFNGTSAAVPYKWVRVALKGNQSVQGYAVDGNTSSSASTHNTAICWNGAQEDLLSGATTCQGMNPQQTNVYMITSMAYNTTGSRKMIQYEVARDILPSPPAALTLDGNGTADNTGLPSSNVTGVSGIDGCGAASSLPGIGTTSANDTTCVTDVLSDVPDGSDPNSNCQGNGNKYKTTNFTGAGGTTPNVSTLSGGTYGSSYQTVGELTAIVNTLTTAADQVWNPNTGICTGASCPSGNATAPTNLGTQGSPTTSLITVIQGDWSGSCSGEGILLVEGNLTCSGSPSWDGEILAIGTGSITVHGGGNGVVNGAMLLTNLCNGTTNNNCGDGTAAFALPTDTTSTALPTAGSFNWTGGGSLVVNYNSCDINNTFNNEPYRILSARELLYR